MSFTYDSATQVGQVRFLIGDTNEAAPLFTDEEINALLGRFSGSLYQTAAACCENLARRYTITSSMVKMGDYQYSSGDLSKTYLDMAARFREVEDNIPVFDVAEENLSGFSELAIIRNYVLRTEGF